MHRWSIAALTLSLSLAHALPASGQADFSLPGTQPLEAGVLLPATNCQLCHGNYNPATEPFFQWSGSMMAQSARDPLFRAALTVANQRIPESGEFCLRCHAPHGWLGGRSTPTDGSMLDENDLMGVQCHSCHKMVDPRTSEGQSLVDPDVPGFGNGMFVVDPNDVRRGPYDDSTPPHDWAFSAFHGEGQMCGTCHEVSNPLFATDKDTQAPHEYGPIERTFSEWELSSFSSMGAAGNCQSCHMPVTSGQACFFGPTRTNSNFQHDFMGANAWIPEVLPLFYEGLDTNALAAAKTRAIQHLQQAAALSATAVPGVGDIVATVRVTNLTGHKLPTGYPEGRRMWLNVKGLDTRGNVIFESGAYDPGTGLLTLDPQAKVYEMLQGLSASQASTFGLAPGPSFHFILNDVTFKDNRIPPAGFDNAAFAARGMAPVGASYADGQHWDETVYHMPINTARLSVALLYQTASKEYVEFLRDETTTDTSGQDLYDAWTTTGRSGPVTMAQTTVDRPLQARAGTVNAGLGAIEDVIFIDGSSGDDSYRVVTRQVHEVFAITVAAPSAGPPVAPGAYYFVLGEPTDLTATPQPLGLGTMVFSSPLTGGSPFRIANTLGHHAQLGTPNVPSQPAPTVLVPRPTGLARPVSVTLQGFIRENGSAAQRPASVTNAVILRVTP